MLKAPRSHEDIIHLVFSTSKGAFSCPAWGSCQTQMVVAPCNPAATLRLWGWSKVRVMLSLRKILAAPDKSHAWPNTSSSQISLQTVLIVDENQVDEPQAPFQVARHLQSHHLASSPKPFIKIPIQFSCISIILLIVALFYRLLCHLLIGFWIGVSSAVWTICMCNVITISSIKALGSWLWFSD